MIIPKELSKVRVSLAVVLSMLSLALGAGASYAAAKFELHETAKTAEEAKTAAAKAQDDVHQHTTDIAVIKQQLADFKESLDRIENAVGTRRGGK